MSTEQASATNIAYAEHEPVVTSPDIRAAGMLDHWQAFQNGQEHSFYRYFMLEVHEDDRKTFLDGLKASNDIPYPNGERQSVLKTGRAILWAVTQGYDNGDPFAVEYVGQRVYPVE